MAQDVRPYKSKEQDGQGNEIILRDQQLVEQGNATTMPSGACFETLDVDNRPVKIPRDNMMNIVLECIGIILNDSSKNLGTNVQKALGLQGNTIGHSTISDFASVLGVSYVSNSSVTDANATTYVDGLQKDGIYFIKGSGGTTYMAIRTSPYFATLYYLNANSANNTFNVQYAHKYNNEWCDWKAL